MMTYKDTFKTVGAIRAAAFDLCDALRGTENESLACEMHDSIVRALAGPSEMTANEVRALTSNPRPDDTEGKS